MRLLATAAMRGRPQAVMLASVLAVLSWLVPPVSVLSSAVVALVTLRRGWIDGLLTIVLGGLACALFGWLALSSPLIGAGVVLLMWLPVWLLASLLRSMRSLDFTVQAALGLAALLVLGQYLGSGDPVADWREIVGPFVDTLVEGELIDAAYRSEVVEAMARWMPGLLAAGFFLQSVAAIFLARWWQAMLYNPGGFRQEFHALRMHKGVALISVGVVGTRLLTGAEGAAWLDFLSMLLTAAWMLQGLALAHGLVARFRASSGWLIGTYVLLLFAPAYKIGLLAAVGFADAWFDFRARSGPRRGPGAPD
jgi:hypothetical protein